MIAKVGKNHVTIPIPEQIRAEPMAFFDTLKTFVNDLRGTDDESVAITFDRNDRHLCAAALMVHIISADGQIKPEETERLHTILTRHYGLSEDEAESLAGNAKTADAEAVDLHRFTSVLRRDLDEVERIALVEDLWEMVYADGELHEFEDNIVWRVAELLGVSTRERMELKKQAKQRLETGQTR